MVGKPKIPTNLDCSLKQIQLLDTPDESQTMNFSANTKLQNALKLSRKGVKTPPANSCGAPCSTTGYSNTTAPPSKLALTPIIEAKEGEISPEKPLARRKTLGTPIGSVIQRSDSPLEIIPAL